MESKKTLVAYFSCTGATRVAAQKLARAADAELYEIKPKVSYTSADLDWTNKKSRSSVEMSDMAFRPELAEKPVIVDGYDMIFVGFPVWWYVAPTIINTFLESCDLSQKTVIPFATSGSSGLGETESRLRPSCSDETKWKPGRIVNRMDEKALRAWVESLGL